MKRLLCRGKQIIKGAIVKWEDLMFKPYVKRKTIEGVKFDFYVGNRQGRDWYDMNATDPIWDEMRHIRDLLIEEGEIIFELGSHHGCTTILLANWVGPEGKVIAFEPDPVNARILRKNIGLNLLSNVEVRQQAAGELTMKAGFAKMAMASRNEGEFCDSVEMIRIDDLISMKPTLLKLDVQGYEVNVLKGAERILDKHPKLAIEVHCMDVAKYGNTVEEMLGLLNLSEYESWILYNDEHEVIKFDGGTERMKRYPYVHLFGVPRTNRSVQSGSTSA